MSDFFRHAAFELGEPATLAAHILVKALYRGKTRGVHESEAPTKITDSSTHSIER